MFSVVKLATGYEVRCPYYTVRWTGIEGLEFLSNFSHHLTGEVLPQCRLACGRQVSSLEAKTTLR